jgi:hypothetical protein
MKLMLKKRAVVLILALNFFGQVQAGPATLVIECLAGFASGVAVPIVATKLVHNGQKVAAVACHGSLYLLRNLIYPDGSSRFNYWNSQILPEVMQDWQGHLNTPHVLNANLVGYGCSALYSIWIGRKDLVKILVKVYKDSKASNQESKS